MDSSQKEILTTLTLIADVLSRVQEGRTIDPQVSEKVSSVHNFILNTFCLFIEKPPHPVFKESTHKLFNKEKVKSRANHAYNDIFKDFQSVIQSPITKEHLLTKALTDTVKTVVKNSKKEKSAGSNDSFPLKRFEKATISKAKEKEGDLKVLLNKTIKRRNKKRKPKKNYCVYCRIHGHMKDTVDCPKFRKNQICEICGSKGHNAGTCSRCMELCSDSDTQPEHNMTKEEEDHFLNS